VTSGGQVSTLEAGEVPEQGRRTLGSRVVKIPAGDRIVEVTRSIGSGESGRADGSEPGGSGGGVPSDGNDQADEGGADLEDGFVEAQAADAVSATVGPPDASAAEDAPLRASRTGDSEDADPGRTGEEQPDLFGA